VAESDDADALLVERARGTEELPASGEVLERIQDSFVDALAALHNLDAGGLDLPGFGGDDLDLWAAIFEGHVQRPAPLVRYALQWLADHRLPAAERTVLCHGDVGPGNFLVEDGQVTALLDWEFAHLGDPMDDLAWLTIRGHHLTSFGDLDRQLARYAERTGLKVEADRVRYWQAVVLTRMAIACLAGLDRRSGRMDTSTYFALLPVLERLLTTVLADLAGVELEATAVPDPGPATARGEVIDALLGDLGTVVGPALAGTPGQPRLLGMTLLLLHLQTADGAAGPVEAADREDLAQLLGADETDLDTFVHQHGRERTADLLHYFSRAADRRIALWPPIVAMAARPLPPVVAP
jgi:hypothetical protein